MIDSEKKYVVVADGKTYRFNEQDWTANMDEFMKDFPQAEIAEVESYKADDYEDNDSIVVRAGDRDFTFSGEDWKTNESEFMKDFPDAQIARVRGVDYHYNQANKLESDINAKDEEIKAWQDSRADRTGMDWSSVMMQQAGLSPIGAGFDPERDAALATYAAEGTRLQQERDELQKQFDSNPRVIEARERAKQMEQEYEDNLLKEINATLTSYDTDKDVVETKMREIDARMSALDGQYGAILPQIGPSKETAEKVRQFDKMGAAKEMIEHAKDIREGKTEGFWQGGAHFFEKEIEGIMYQTESDTMVQIAMILKDLNDKVGNLNKNLTPEVIDENLSKDDALLLRAYFSMMSAQKEVGTGWRYKAGEIAAAAIPFALEFAAIGGFADDVAKGATKGLQLGLERWVAEGIEKGGKAIGRKVGKYAAEIGTKGLIKAAMMTAMRPSTYSTIAQHLPTIDEEGNVKLGKNATIGALDSFIETISELSGGVIEDILGLGMKWGKGVTSKIFGDSVKNIKFGKWAKALTNGAFGDYLKQAGFHGLPTEIMEEYIGNTMRLIYDKDALKEMHEDGNGAAMWLGFVPMTLFGGAMSAGAFREVDQRAAQIGEKLNALLLEKEFTKERADALTERRTDKSPLELGIQMNELREELKKKGATQEELEMVDDYAIAVAEFQTMRGVTEIREKQDLDEVRADLTRQYGTYAHNGNVTTAKTTDGRSVFIVSDKSATGEYAAVDMQTGQHITISDADIAMQNNAQGQPVQTLSSKPENQYIGDRLLERNRLKEAERMLQERNEQIAKIKELMPEQLNLGTEGEPNMVVVKSQDANGVTVVDANGNEAPMSWDAVGRVMGMPIHTFTDMELATMEAQEIALKREALRAARAKTYAENNNVSEELEQIKEKINDVTPKPEAEYTDEQTGEVDEVSFWENDPEGYCDWNDRQNNDGGVDSIEQLENSIASLTSQYDAATKASKTDNPMSRKTANREAKRLAERIQRLQAIQNGYLERFTEQIMSAVESAEQRAETVIAMRERINEWREKFNLDESKLTVYESLDEVENAEARKQIMQGAETPGWTTGSRERGMHAYVYLPHVKDMASLDKVIMHEVVTHYGLKTLLGEKDYNALMDKVWNMMSDSARRTMSFYPGVQYKEGDERRRTAAEEFVALVAEDIVMDKASAETSSLWKRVADAIAEKFDKMQVRLSGTDVAGIVKDNYTRLEAEGKSEATAEEGATEDMTANAEEVLVENGYDVDEQNGDVRFSSRYITNDAQREDIISSIVEVTGRSAEDAERWLQSEESVASLVLADKEYLDYDPDEKYKAIKDNSDYPQGTVDFNNICRKRIPFTKMYTRLQRRYPNRIFTAEELADIRTIMSEDGLTVACGLCYVEDRRQQLGEVADGFIADLKDGFKTYAQANATKKGNAVKFLILVGSDSYVPTIYDLITLEGSDKLYREHRGIWDAFGAYNRARGQQTQNTFQGYAEYKREILGWSKAKVNKVNSLGGLRVFSYSDFEAHHLLDLVQIIIDCAAKGVMIQGYTKVPEFARVVANTNIKLNRSLIPLGDTGIVDGQLAFDPVEGIDINDPNFLESNDNVGNILIGINSEQIRLAMADPRIHYIIPYHARQARSIRNKLNVGAWSNYTDTQNERDAKTGKKVADNINIYTDILGPDVTNDREFVEKYLQKCAEMGRIPKFDEFLDKDAEGNYVYTPGYYKFLVDFKLFDENGNILPQKPVVAQFDDAFNMQILQDYAKGERETTGEQMNATYDKIVDALGLDESAAEGEDVRFSVKLKDSEIDNLVKAMKANAEVAEDLELTPENWEAQFGTDGMVPTPVGNVKMGENQYLKLLQRKRSQYFGMIRPTLANPDIVLEELSPSENGERDTVLLFIKTFIKPDGSRYVHFESVTIQKDSMEISISSHEIQEEDLKKKMRNDNVAHLRDSLSASEVRLNGRPSDGSDLVPTPSDNLSDSKDSENLETPSESARFSVITPQMDADYLAAVERGDMETAQRMVLEAAKLAMPNTKVVDENGNPKVVYHGTINPNFNVFDIEETEFDAFHFATTEQGAKEAILNKLDIDVEDTEEADNALAKSRIIKAFLNVPNLKRVTDGEANDIALGRMEGDKSERAGYVYENEVEALGEDSYVVFNSSQIKSADPVTYDDNGNVIPLSERFNPENEDIRFSARSDEQREKLFADAKARFGLTNNFKVAGYMLPDGSLLDFSEANDGGDPNQRTLDHREIEGIIMDEGVEYDSRWMYLADFMNEGAIRLLPEYAGINLMKAPTKEQRQRLMDFIYKYNGEVILEITDERLNNAAYVEYDRRTSPARIFRDIDGYFNEGIVPQQDTMFKTANNNQAIFVSNAAKAVEGIQMGKATPEQWLKMIEKSGGLKAGEDKWMGLSDWLKASDKKTLTKQEVLDYVNEHMIQIEEVHYAANAEGNAEDTYVEIQRILQNKFDDYMQEYYESHDVEDDYGDEARDYAMDRLHEEFNDEFPYAIERSQSDVYLTFPYEEVEDLENWAAKVGIDFKAENPINDTRLNYTTEDLDNKREIALTVPTIVSWNESDEVHFGDAGDGRAVAWIRFGETTDESGNKVLVIDEIQSKRHQEGREKGYATTKEDVIKATEAFQSFNRAMREKYGENVFPSKWSEADQAEFDRLRDEQSRISREYDKGVPDAPFAKNWHELAMKRMLRYAAENGYDVIAWTKGEQQVSRYNLGGVVSAITMAEEHDGFIDFLFDVRGQEESSVIGVEKETGIVHLAEEPLSMAEGKPLSELVGKEIAEKMMQMKEDEVLDGQNLQIGGEGMKGFYDRMLPAFMDKYGKKWGVKTTDIELPNLEEAGRVMHSIPVTEEMKESVMEGQVMFKTRMPNQAVAGFLNEVVPEFESKYNVVAPASIMKLPTRAALAKAIKLDISEIDDEFYDEFLKKWQKSYAAYVPVTDEDGKLEHNIIIFAVSDYKGSFLADLSLFHENIHGFVQENEDLLKLGEWLYENDGQDAGIAAIKPEVMKYRESERPEEMLTHYVSAVMAMGYSQKALDTVPDELKPLLNYIYERFGYNPETEDGERRRRYVSERDEINGRTWTDRPSVSVTKGERKGGNGQNLYRTAITPEVRKEMDTISAQAIVNGNYLKAPNGKDTKLTPEQWALVRTKNFKDWFGDWENDPENASKVVDENGEPMVVHHGTISSRFSTFDDSVRKNSKAPKETYWFAEDRDNAMTYAGSEEGMYATFLNLRTPAIIDAKDGAWYELPADFEVYDGAEIDEMFDTIEEAQAFAREHNINEDDIEARGVTDTNAFVKRMKDSGKYDGVIIKNVIDAGDQDVEYEVRPTNEYVVFSSNQIKSATENNGEYSEDEDIRFKTYAKEDLNDSNIATALSELYDDFEHMENDIYGTEELVSWIGRILGNYDGKYVADLQDIIDTYEEDTREFGRDFDEYGGRMVDTEDRDAKVSSALSSLIATINEPETKESKKPSKVKGMSDATRKEISEKANKLLNEYIKLREETIEQYGKYYEWDAPKEVVQRIDKAWAEYSLAAMQLNYPYLYKGEEGATLFKTRTAPAPTKTQEVYKLMRLGSDGKLYPLFIGSAEPIELVTWYDAESPNLGDLTKLASGVHLVNNETGEAMTLDEFKAQHPEIAIKGKRPNVAAINWATENGARWIEIEDKATAQRRYEGESRSYYNLGINGSGQVGQFAMRPGWHAGSLPTMRQIGKGKDKNLRDDSFVWVKGRIPADVDYQSEADANPDKDIPTHIPTDGFYMKATNANAKASQADKMGWYVAGSFIADEIMSDAEARSVIDSWNAEHPDAKVEYDYPRVSGREFDPARGGLVESDTMFKTDPSTMNVDELVEQGKQKVIAENKDAIDVFMDRIRAINGNLQQLRMAAAAQRQYDKRTVDAIVKQANELLEAGKLADLTRGEIKRILSVVNNATGKVDLTNEVGRLMDIMIANQLRMGRENIDKFLRIRGKKVDQRGVEVRGRLDIKGQLFMDTIRENIGNDLLDILMRIVDVQEKLTSESEVVRRNAENELIGLEFARQYVENIKDSEKEEKRIRQEIKDAEQEYKDGVRDRKTFVDFANAANEAIRENRIQRVLAYQKLAEDLAKLVTGSITNAGLLRDAEKDRVQKIQHFANSDLKGLPYNEHGKVDSMWWNNPFVRFLLKPLATFDQMLRHFGSKSVNGEGYLWNHFMRGWLRATEAEYKGVQAAHEILDAKAREVFRREGIKKWSDIFEIDRKLPTATVTWWDGGEMRDHEVTQGNLLYIYMVNKMTDGKMKLRKMGITEDDVDDIKNALDPRFIALADWIQDEFLPSLRDKYNALHEKLFGASMAAIDSYFPIRVLANAREREVDLGVEESNAKPSTITGSIIKRTRNSLALDILGSNAFDVVLDHIQQMEHWAAFAEFNQDLNTLLSYRRFRNRVQNMSGIYGSGNVVWNNFRSVAELAAGLYQPASKSDSIDKTAINLAKGVTSAKISFRVYTAIKQLLSMPAFVSDARADDLLEFILTPWEAWNWAMENLPLFEKRWKSRQAGDSRLMQTDSDWKLWKTKVVELASRYGMSPNAFVDAVTVAIGARSIYESKKRIYMKMGYQYEEASERAKQDATILFNESQQSNESAFLSTMQVDRTAASVAFSLFRNSSMGYQRMFVDALRNIKRKFTKGYKEESIEFMKKQLIRDGLEETAAEKAANRMYTRSIMHSAMRAVTFGFVVQFAWNLGAYLPYLIAGDDDDEKRDMVKDAARHALFGPIEGLSGGSVLSEMGNLIASGEGLKDYDPTLLPVVSDMKRLLNMFSYDEVAAANEMFNLLIQAGIGVNPQTLTDSAVAIIDACNGDLKTATEATLCLLRILQIPQTLADKIYIDEIDFTADKGLELTIYEFAKRYADYKIKRGAPLTGWMYSSEKEQERIDKYIKRFDKMAEEYKRSRGNEEAKKYYEYLDTEYKEVTETIADLKRKAQAEGMKGNMVGAMEYAEMLDEFMKTDVFQRYTQYGGMAKAVEKLRDQLLKVDNPTMEMLEDTMLEIRKEMVEEMEKAND